MFVVVLRVKLFMSQHILSASFNIDTKTSVAQLKEKAVYISWPSLRPTVREIIEPAKK